MSVVLDSSAIMAVLLNEAGSAHVEPHLLGAHVSAVVLAEVVGINARSGQPEDQIRFVLDAMELQVHELSIDRAWQVGLMLPITRHLGLSFGDRACVALGIELQLPVMTGDRAWQKLVMPGLDIRMIR